MPHYKIIRNGRVLDLTHQNIADVDILIEDHKIKTIGAAIEAPADADVIDATDRLLMPGLVNAHTHGHGALSKGVGDRWTLELLLNGARWISGHQSAQYKYLSTLLGALEMVRKGCTACYDLFLELPLPSSEGIQAIVQAYTDAGMRAVIAPMMADRSFYQAIPGVLDALPESLRKDVAKATMQPGAANVEACRAFLQQFSIDSDHIRFALAPTIPLHCSDEFIVANRDLARDYDIGLHMHLAESKIQALAGMQSYGKTLTAHLDELGFLGPNFTAAHGVWLDDDDILRLADNGCSVAHNPGSNLRLGSGISAVREMLDAGMNVGIGTDGANCSDNQNMFEAMRFASFVSRARSHNYERWLSTAETLMMATQGSAKALGFADDIGQLEPGYKADIVFLDLNHVNLIPLNNVINQLVHTEDGSAVDSVMVDGEFVLQQGQFTRIDIASIRRQIEVAVADMSRLNSEAKQLCEQLEQHVGHFCIGLAQQPYHINAMAARMLERT